jgi:hypothetical protein
VHVEPAERRETGARVFHAAFVDEPARGFGDEEYNGHGDEGNHRGDGKWDAPLQRLVRLLEESEIDPGFEKVAQTDEAAVENDMFSAVGGGRAFGLPDWDRGAQSTDTPSEDESADDELRELEASALQDLADKRQDSSDENNLPAAEDVAVPGAPKSTEQRADSECCNDGALDG